MLTKTFSRRDLGFGAAAIALTACAKTGTQAEAAEVKTMTEKLTNIDWALSLIHISEPTRPY